jgi:hypothetical protein
MAIDIKQLSNSYFEAEARRRAVGVPCLLGEEAGVVDDRCSPQKLAQGKQFRPLLEI